MAVEARERLSEMNHWNKESVTAAVQFDQTQYDKAQLHAIQCQKALADVFKEIDAIITPSAPGEATTDLVSISRSAFNRIWTLMHGPCVTIPAFEGPNGMPVGLQVVGPLGTMIASSRSLRRSRRVLAWTTER